MAQMGLNDGSRLAISEEGETLQFISNGTGLDGGSAALYDPGGEAELNDEVIKELEGDANDIWQSDCLAPARCEPTDRTVQRPSCTMPCDKGPSEGVCTICSLLVMCCCAQACGRLLWTQRPHVRPELLWRMGRFCAALRPIPC